MPDWANALSFWLTLLIMLGGLALLIVPIFPGITVIWLAAVIYGFVTGFDTLGIIMIVFITLGMIAGISADNVLMGAGALKGGASWLTIIVALVAGIAGTIIFPPIGGFIAIPIAIFLLELLRNREWRSAWRATRGMALGWGLSFLVRFGIGLVMIAAWLIWAFSQF
ncbi:MAG: DUF456 domain-containing protein [Chloroflexota bacterium]|nr:MAG: DUF456 domain-containing protein [Chloroflexota bacterium]UCF27474.1 MAG: DUF456 domain-containing protein [Chloroflexota bacterium]